MAPRKRSFSGLSGNERKTLAMTIGEGREDTQVLGLKLEDRDAGDEGCPSDLPHRPPIPFPSLEIPLPLPPEPFSLPHLQKPDGGNQVVTDALSQASLPLMSTSSLIPAPSPFFYPPFGITQRSLSDLLPFNATTSQIAAATLLAPLSVPPLLLDPWFFPILMPSMLRSPGLPLPPGLPLQQQQPPQQQQPQPQSQQYLGSQTSIPPVISPTENILKPISGSSLGSSLGSERQGSPAKTPCEILHGSTGMEKQGWKGVGKLSASGERNPATIQNWLSNFEGMGHPQKIHEKLETFSFVGEKGISRYRCPVSGCGKDYARSEHLGRHLRTHVNGRIYECKECKKTFNRTDTLLQHYKIHEKGVKGVIQISFEASNADQSKVSEVREWIFKRGRPKTKHKAKTSIAAPSAPAEGQSQ